MFWNLKVLRLSFGERWCMLFPPSVRGLPDLIAVNGFGGGRGFFFSLKFMTWCSLTSRRVVCVCRLLVITNDRDTQIWILIALRKLPWIVNPCVESLSNALDLALRMTEPDNDLRMALTSVSSE